MSLKAEASNLLKNLLTESSKLKDPNFRAYFYRIAESDFKTTPAPTAEFLAAQTKNLEILTRQVAIQNMYFSEEFSTSR